MKKESYTKTFWLNFFVDAWWAFCIFSIFVGFKLFQLIPGNYFIASLPFFVWGYFYFEVGLRESRVENKNFLDNELNYLEGKNFNLLYSNSVFTNENSFTFAGINKENFYLHTRFTYKGDSEPTEIKKVFKLKEIQSGYLKLNTEIREKVSKKSMFKKSAAGGLIFGWKGVIAGALFADIKEDEKIDGWSLWIKLKGFSRNIPLFPESGLKDSYKFAAKLAFENSFAQTWYILLVEKDLSILRFNESNEIVQRKEEDDYLKTAEQLWNEGKI